jgi:hypothetical protein
MYRRPSGLLDGRPERPALQVFGVQKSSIGCTALIQIAQLNQWTGLCAA